MTVAGMRPNILLLHTDQQRFDTLAAWGAAHMVTPNLDRLAAMGTSFTRAYSSCPICQPARHDLLTGASARHHGYYSNTGRPINDYRLATLPRMLTQAGYETLAIGKMHFSPAREHHGFEHMYLMEEFPGSREQDEYLQYLDSAGYGHIRCQHGARPLVYHTPQVSAEPEEHHGSAWVATKTIEKLRVERDRPFFIFASWVGPHPPYYMPQEYLDMYRDKACPQPCPLPPDAAPNFPPSPDDVEDQPIRLKRMREAYFGAVTLIDRHIGRILDVLEEIGQMDNTFIFFTSDHGEMLGDRGMYMKMVPYEGAAHIPLIVAGPGVEAGRQCSTVCTTWDTAQSIMDCAGLSWPEGHPAVGESLLCEAFDDSERTAVYHYSLGRRRYLAAVNVRHKFVHWLNGGNEELYDLQNDPWEQENLLARQDAAAGEVADSLRAECIRFEIEHGVAENVRDGQFVDLPYEAIDRMAAGLYPDWAQYSFPQWMVGAGGGHAYRREDLKSIASEIRRCLGSETAHVFSDRQYRRNAIDQWTVIGGAEKVYHEFFEIADRPVQDQDTE